MSTGQLYELGGVAEALRRAIDEAPIDEKTGEVLISDDVYTVLEKVEGDIESLLVDAEKYARTLDADAAPIDAKADAFEAEAERIRKHSVRLRREAEGVRRAIYRWMVAHKTERVRAPADGIALVLHSGSTSVVVVDRKVVPMDYLREPPPPPPVEEWDVDKASAGKTLKATVTDKTKGFKPEGTVVEAGKVIPGLALVRGAPKLVVE